MATPERRAISPARTPKPEKIVDFQPARLKASFFLRCAALLIDYILMLALPIGWLAWGKAVGDVNPTGSLGTSVWLLAAIVWVFNFLLLPLFRGQTVGKLMTGITIVNIDGTNVRLSGILLRNVLGYFITGLTLGIGFMIAGINTSGRAFHDFIGGTIVVSGRKKAI